MAVWRGPLFAVAAAAVTLWAAAHVVLRKNEPRSALGWLGVVLVLRPWGALCYYIFGINRISRRAEDLYSFHEPETLGAAHCLVEPEDLEGWMQPQMVQLARFVERYSPSNLSIGNEVLPLTTGSMAYEEMLRAIDEADRAVTLGTYIFDNDSAGDRFRDALVRAKLRGVAVKVLIDAVGDRYSWPSMSRRLRSNGLDCAVFNPTLWPKHMAYSNLRNHRKVLIVDGTIGFTGGMNIRHGHILEENPSHPVRDMHFRLRGPAVASLQQVFIEDWAFATGERLTGSQFFPPLGQHGETVCRVIDDGPAGRFGHLRWTLLGALACARRRVRIATPYFLPDEGLTSAMATAVRRGVEVELLLPERGNLRIVEWATRAMLDQLLASGVRVHWTPPPFDHTKLMLVDEQWALIGSANWDPRSLRLNFELVVECFSGSFAARLGRELDQRRDAGRRVKRREILRRSLPVRLRDGLARLASPYL